MSLSVFGGSTAIAVVGVALLVLSCTAVVQCTQLEKADAIETRLKDDNRRLAQTIDDEKAARAETERRFNAQRDIANEVQRQLDRKSALAPVAAAATGRMLAPFEAGVARSSPAPGYPASAASAPDAPETGLLLPKLYGKLVARARAMGERIDSVNGYADTLRAKGEGLEQSYDALKP